MAPARAQKVPRVLVRLARAVLMRVVAEWTTQDTPIILPFVAHQDDIGDWQLVAHSLASKFKCTFDVCAHHSDTTSAP